MKRLLLLLFLLINLIGTASALTFENTSNCPISKSTYWNNCFGTYTYPGGDKYVGEWKDNAYHGQGTYTYANGDKYVGEWKDNAYHGQGTYTWGPSSEWVGDKFVGGYKNGKRHGQGTYTYADGTIERGIWENGELLDANVSNLSDCPEDTSSHWHNCFGTYTASSSGEWAGDKYVGEFKDDKFHGHGTYTFSISGELAGYKYTGKYSNNKRHGQGTMTYPGGDKYVGEWENGDRKKGTYTYPDGENYVGEYKNDKPHGQGTYAFADGENYVGEFKNGEYHGQGTYTLANGSKYVGEFKDGNYHGFGKLTYGSSSEWAGYVFVGKYRDNERNGQGTMTYPNGDKYVGGWKDNKKHGQGTYTNADGTIESGIWENGELLDVNVNKLPDCPEDTSSYWHNCFGTYTDDSEDKYVGGWKDNKKHGQGTYTWGPTSEFAGDKYVGEYKDGTRHGQGTYTWGPSSKWAGDKYVGEFKDEDGKRHGQGTYTFSNGDEYVGEHKNGEYHGQGTYTYTDGTIERGVWENGELLDANNEEPKKQTIPNNAHASGSGWLCNSGYIKSGNKCVIKKISKTLKDGDNAYDKKDYKTALSIYSSLAEQGTVEAQYNLGWMYKHGEGVVKSVEEAIKWYTKAAEQGNTFAQYSLGIIYIDGEGIPIDYKKALSWWRKSAKQGYPHSEYALGWLYENGYGVKQDTKKALSWYLKADAQGNSKAKERIEELLLPQDDAPATADENSTEGYTFAGSGSGFVVSEDGVIATNNHVIDGCQKLIVDDLKATVISKDVQNDLALVKVNNKYKYVSILSYKSPRLGDNINVFGYPLSDMFSDEHISLTKGSVSSLAGFEGDLSNFRFTAPVQPGNSGGPVVNEEGVVVGITKAVLGSKVLDELKFLPQNVNFGIRSNLLINMMESKLVDVISEPISESDFIDHYSKATKFIKCYE